MMFSDKWFYPPGFGLAAKQEGGYDMTTPTERYTALVRAEVFLTNLLYPTQTPNVPKVIRERARLVLRHYPTQYELSLIAQGNSVFLQDPEHQGAKPEHHLVSFSDEPTELIPKKRKKTKRKNQRKKSKTTK